MQFLGLAINSLTFFLQKKVSAKEPFSLTCSLGCGPSSPPDPARYQPPYKIYKKLENYSIKNMKIHEIFKNSLQN